MLAFVAVVIAGVATADTSGDAANRDEYPRRSYYIDHGVPDPRGEWEAADYYDAVRALMDLPASELPRASGQAGSRLLFARLLAARSEAPQGIAGSTRDLSLVQLYADAHSETSDFDIELIEVLNNELRIVLATAMRYEEIEAARRDAIALFEARGSEAEASDLAEELESYDEFYSDSSSRIRFAAEALIRLGADSSIGDAGKSHLIQVLRGRLPESGDRLSPEDRSWLARLVEAMSQLPQNAEKKQEMGRLRDIVR